MSARPRAGGRGRPVGSRDARPRTDLAAAVLRDLRAVPRVDLGELRARVADWRAGAADPLAHRGAARDRPAIERVADLLDRAPEQVDRAGWNLLIAVKYGVTRQSVEQVRARWLRDDGKAAPHPAPPVTDDPARSCTLKVLPRASRTNRRRKDQ